MPTYEYQCDACDHHFEKFQQITASSLRKCPQCGRRKLRRLIGAGAAVIFRGSGFYQTDYRSQSYREAAEKEKPPDKEKPAGKEKPADKEKTAGEPAEDSGKKDSKPDKGPPKKEAPD